MKEKSGLLKESCKNVYNQCFVPVILQLKLAYVSLCFNRNVNENEIKILAFDREPDKIIGLLEYQGAKIPMKIRIPWHDRFAGNPVHTSSLASSLVSLLRSLLNRGLTSYFWYVVSLWQSTFQISFNNKKLTFSYVT